MTLEEAIAAIERDRREPDKVLLGVFSLRRILFDLGVLGTDPPEAYGVFGECDLCPRAAVMLTGDWALCQRCGDLDADRHAEHGGRHAEARRQRIERGEEP
jgi:hypothetical protein